MYFSLGYVNIRSIMSEVPAGGNPEQPVDGVREASDNFLTRMHGSTKAILCVAAVTEGLAVKSLFEEDPGMALAKGIFGGASIAFAVLTERTARRLDAQSAAIRQRHE